MNHGIQFVRISQFAKFHGVCNKTIIRWCDSGKIPFKLTQGGQRVFELPSSQNKPSSIEKRNDKVSICYVRVSTQKQKHSGDLERQSIFMSNQFPGHEIVRDVGSGLNFKRKGLFAILERIKGGNIQQLVVASRDRLSRFGFDFFKWFCESYGTQLLVLDSSLGSQEQELTQDILAILHVFSCRINGRRRYTKQQDSLPQIETQIEASEQDIF
jgi:predicted site-specific integrase-resolvase